MVKKVKVDGMPAVRPTCACCERKLLFWSSETRGPNPNGGTLVVSREWKQWKGYGNREDGTTPLFCTLRCALSFAVTSWHMLSNEHVKSEVKLPWRLNIRERVGQLARSLVGR